MIMGGSFASSGDNGASVFCRYHFRPHFLQHSGFRLVTSSSVAPATLVDEETGKTTTLGSAQTSNVYETSDLVDQYLGLHFPESGRKEAVPAILPHVGSPVHALGFPQRVSQLLAAVMGPEVQKGRALDLGCAVGGGSFELAALGFEEVVGIDFSSAFIAAAKSMQRADEVRFKVPMEGDLGDEVIAKHAPNTDANVRAKVTFRTGDACRLIEDSAALGTFDGAVLANLLCRLPEPLACLDGLSAVMRTGGVVVIVTPFSWLEQFTPRSQWFGGFQDPQTGAAVASKERLIVEMERRGFVKVHEEQMPLIIREHQRKYQYIVSEATAWRRK